MTHIEILKIKEKKKKIALINQVKNEDVELKMK